MFKSLKVQFKIMLNSKSFQFAFLIVLIFNLYSYIQVALDNRGIDIVNMYSADASVSINSWSRYIYIFAKLFPFIVAFPFALSVIDDSNTKINTFILTRMKKKKYIISKLAVCFAGGFIIIFVPFLVNILLCKITFPDNLNDYLNGYYSKNWCRSILGTNCDFNTVQKGLPFFRIFLYSQFLYNVFYIFLLSIFSGILGMFAMSFSFIIKRYKVLILIPVYVFFMIITNIGTIYNSKSDLFINFNWLDYFSVQGYDGQSILLLLGILSFITITIILTSTVFYKKDVR